MKKGSPSVKKRKIESKAKQISKAHGKNEKHRTKQEKIGKKTIRNKQEKIAKQTKTNRKKT